VANELLASLDDINAHLPSDKAAIEDADDDLLQVEVYRLVRAKLSSAFATTTMNTWVDPASTPEVIRTIAGLVIAAKWYALLYAEDSTDDARYANWLYAQAMDLINGILAGNTAVIDPGGEVINDTGSFGDADFFPNDDSPAFTMSKEFA